MISRLQSANVTVFDTHHKDFRFGLAAAHLKRGELVVLHARIDKDVALNSGYNWLSMDEVRRYDSYICRNAAKQFLKGRTLVRNVIAHCLSAAPADIKLSCTQHVKPTATCGTISRPTPQFNLSHSGKWVSTALHKDLPVGIDVECSAVPELQTLCASLELLTQNERKCLAACHDSNHKADLFLQLWRCKEAIMKATGKGFGLAPCSIDVLAPDGTARKIIRAEGSAWRLRQIAIRSGPTCAVAVQHLEQ